MVDNKELAEYLYNEISEHQGDEDVKRTRPMTWPTGLYFNSSDLEYWIEQFKCKDFVGHSEWSEEYQKICEKQQSESNNSIQISQKES